MSTFGSVRCAGYGREEIQKSLCRLLESLGGMKQFITPGDLVLLKPNLLSASSPSQCVTTHPEVVRAVAALVIEAKGYPFIADSPGLDGFASVARKTGMADIAKELNIPCKELDDPVPLPMTPGSIFQKIEVSRQAVEADKIINLPKLKTHAQMMLTLGVKNLFGTVVRQRKAEWHYNVGLNRDIFANLHIDIARGLTPVLTILDGIDGMDGQGPGNGRPRHFGLLAASSDPLALDLRICSLLGGNLNDFPLYRAACRRELVPKIEETEAQDFPADFRFKEVDIPRLDSLHLLPSFLDGFGKRHLASRPVQNRKACVRCGKCAALCPAHAMTLSKEGNIDINYELCIRCYCCQEVCPANAISFSKGFILRILEMFRK